MSWFATKNPQGWARLGTLLILLGLPWNEGMAQRSPRHPLTPQQQQHLLKEQQLQQQQLQAIALYPVAVPVPVPSPVNPNQPQPNPVPRPQAVRVLFIGNGDTATNQLPELVAALARAANLPPLAFDTQLEADATLTQHVRGGKAVAKIRQGKWDIVVLQEQSLAPVLAPDDTLQAARALNQEIARINARPLYFQTWPQRTMLESLEQISKVCQACAKQANNAGIAPVGQAFILAQAADLNLALYQKDNVRPTPAGSYLAACVIFTTIYGRSPVGLPAPGGAGGQSPGHFACPHGGALAAGGAQRHPGAMRTCRHQAGCSTGPAERALVCPVPASGASKRRISSMACRASASVMTRGGAMRTTFLASAPSR